MHRTPIRPRVPAKVEVTPEDKPLTKGTEKERKERYEAMRSDWSSRPDSDDDEVEEVFASPSSRDEERKERSITSPRSLVTKDAQTQAQLDEPAKLVRIDPSQIINWVLDEEDKAFLTKGWDNLAADMERQAELLRKATEEMNNYKEVIQKHVAEESEASVRHLVSAVHSSLLQFCFVFQPESNNKAAIEKFRTSVDEINSNKVTKKLSLENQHTNTSSKIALDMILFGLTLIITKN
ncbi:hypothetical protein K1T71_015031 [Dendrolimus kikuchii]|nr:hypothetical protein K1T71_015031 [Dendrolimus kikuchii]